jgi:hypothetical protein
MPRTATLASLSEADLRAAVDLLVAAGQITDADVHVAADRARRARAIEAELARLRGGGSNGTVAIARATTTRTGTAAKTSGGEPRDARGHRLTPKARAAKKIQGQYLGLLAKLRSAGRVREFNRVRAIGRKDGVVAALKTANDLVKNA